MEELVQKRNGCGGEVNIIYLKFLYNNYCGEPSKPHLRSLLRD